MTGNYAAHLAVYAKRHAPGPEIPPASGPLPIQYTNISPPLGARGAMSRMDLFDKLLSADPTIARASGDIMKRMDDVREGFQVGSQALAMTPFSAHCKGMPRRDFN